MLLPAGLFATCTESMLGANGPSYLDWSLLPMMLYATYYFVMARQISVGIACAASGLVALGWAAFHCEQCPLQRHHLLYLQ